MREGQGLADRGTFVVDPDGIIQAMEITAEGIGRDAENLLNKVRAEEKKEKYESAVFFSLIAGAILVTGLIVSL